MLLQKFDDDDVYYYIRWRLKLGGETENIRVCTKERRGVTAAVLMATPRTNSLGGDQEVKVWGRSMKDVGGAVLAGSSPPFLERKSFGALKRKRRKTKTLLSVRWVLTGCELPGREAPRGAMEEVSIHASTRLYTREHALCGCGRCAASTRAGGQTTPVRYYGLG